MSHNVTAASGSLIFVVLLLFWAASGTDMFSEGKIKSKIDTESLKQAELGKITDQSMEADVVPTYNKGTTDSIIFEYGMVATDIDFVESGEDLTFEVKSYNLKDIKMGVTLEIGFWENQDTIFVYLQEVVIPAGGSAEFSVLKSLRTSDSFNEDEMTIRWFTIKPWYEVIEDE